MAEFEGENRRENQWHLDKRVPLGLIAALFLQTASLVFVGATWKAETDQRLQGVEEDIADNIEIRRRMWDQIKNQEAVVSDLANKVTAVDERTKGIKDSVDRLLTLWLADKNK